MTRWAVLVAVALTLGVALPSVVVSAQAQPAAVGGAAPARAAAAQMRPHNDIAESAGAGMAILFWVFAAASVVGALFVITRRNLVAAVMGMVGSFLGISAVYMMLYAPFLAVIQMLVYAGAIMVLFVFVIMILNRPEDEPVGPTGRVGKVVGGLAIAYLVGRLAMLFGHLELPKRAAGLAAPANIQLPPVHAGASGESVAWGTLKAVGMDLFGPGLFPFEAISIVLLVAVVGAIAIARPLHGADDPGKSLTRDNESGSPS